MSAVPCPVFASYTLAFALQLRNNHGKPLAYPGGVWGVKPPPPRNYSDVLTKPSRISSSVENTF
jgi:hypothetical protein